MARVLKGSRSFCVLYCTVCMQLLCNRQADFPLLVNTRQGYGVLVFLWIPTLGLENVELRL